MEDFYVKGLGDFVLKDELCLRLGLANILKLNLYYILEQGQLI